jgi:hypothetical protein
VALPLFFLFAIQIISGIVPTQVIIAAPGKASFMRPFLDGLLRHTLQGAVPILKLNAELRFLKGELSRPPRSERASAWKNWGPCLSERQWGTVRADYSENGDAWNFFTHDQARSRAYRWGEDGLGGISDDKQRLFELTNAEGNQGEDVKEYYFYLDSTSTPYVTTIPADYLPPDNEAPVMRITMEEKENKSKT